MYIYFDLVFVFLGKNKNKMYMHKNDPKVFTHRHILTHPFIAYFLVVGASDAFHGQMHRHYLVIDIDIDILHFTET